MTVALVAASALVAACVQAATGLGFALILTPVLFALMQPLGAIVSATVLGLVLNLLVLFGEHRRPTVAWSEARPILAAAVPGSVFGLLVLVALPKPVLQIAVGIAVIAAALMRVSGHVHIRADGRFSRLTLGFATGTLSTSTGVSGPPLALWLSARQLPPTDLRDSLSALFLGTGAIAAVTLLPVLDRAQIHFTDLAAAAASVAVGHAIGSRLFTRLAPGRFNIVLLAIVLVGGAASLSAGAHAI